jgi:RNA polymerase sporulation-specific sigma factor
MDEPDSGGGVGSFMPILAREAGKLAYGNSFTADDLLQEGVLAAMAALESFDPARGNLQGYVRICARNRMISYLRRNGHELPMDEEALDERLSSGAGFHGADGPWDAEGMREAMPALFERLSPFEVDVLNAYLKSGSVSGAAAMVGCQRKKADNAMQRVRQKARAMEY